MEVGLCNQGIVERADVFKVLSSGNSCEALRALVFLPRGRLCVLILF
jgi:hypothetical protein